MSDPADTFNRFTGKTYEENGKLFAEFRLANSILERPHSGSELYAISSADVDERIGSLEAEIAQGKLGRGYAEGAMFELRRAQTALKR